MNEEVVSAMIEAARQRGEEMLASDKPAMQALGRLYVSDVPAAVERYIMAELTRPSEQKVSLTLNSLIAYFAREIAAIMFSTIEEDKHKMGIELALSAFRVNLEEAKRVSTTL